MTSHLGGCIIEGDIGTWAPEVWETLIAHYSLSTVVDVGCGAGHSLDYFLQHGLTGFGIEGWTEAIERSSVRNHIVAHDYTFGPYVPDAVYDLCWCCEFVEHVDERYTQNFIATFRKAKVVAMTHARPGQPGHHHVNCQAEEYWIRLLALSGLSVNLDYSHHLRRLLFDNDGNCLPHGGHVRNTLLVFTNAQL